MTSNKIADPAAAGFDSAASEFSQDVRDVAFLVRHLLAKDGFTVHPALEDDLLLAFLGLAWSSRSSAFGCSACFSELAQAARPLRSDFNVSIADNRLRHWLWSRAVRAFVDSSWPADSSAPLVAGDAFGMPPDALAWLAEAAVNGLDSSKLDKDAYELVEAELAELVLSHISR